MTVLRNDQLVVQVQPVTDGIWHTYGAELYDDGIWPENFSFTSILPGGMDSCQFTLHRSPRVNWDDLNPYDPVEVSIGGFKVFSGRIREVPSQTTSTDESITVTCEGIKYSLADTVIARNYIQTDMGIWRDVRTFNHGDQDFTWELRNKQGAVSIDQKRGAILLDVADGSNVNQNQGVGIMLDQGPFASQYAQRIDIHYQTVSAHASWNLRIKSGMAIFGSGSLPPAGSGTLDVHDSPALANDSATNGRWISYTFMADPISGLPSSQRYISLHLTPPNGNITNTSNVYVEIDQIVLYRDASYGRGGSTTPSTGSNTTSSTGLGGSVITAQQIMGNLMSEAVAVPGALLKDADLASASGIVKDFTTQGYASILDIVDMATAFVGYDWLIDTDAILYWKAPPTQPLVPEFQTSLGAGALLSVTGSSGQDLYSTALVSGSQSDGTITRVTNNNVDNAVWVTSGAPQATNPGAEPVGTTGWTNVVGTLGRDTTQFHSGVASMGLTTDGTGNFQAEYTGWTGNFIEGQTYQVTVWSRMLLASGTTITIGIQDHFQTVHGTTQITLGQITNSHTDNNWYQNTFQFTADFTGPASLIVYTTNSSVNLNTRICWIDDISVSRNAYGLLGRRGLTRTVVLPVNSKVDNDDATAIGNAFLANASGYPPFRGTLTVQGDTMVMDAVTNEPIPPYMIKVGQTILISDIPDPNRQGALGRVGKVVQVQYNHDTKTAQIDLDNSRDWTRRLSTRLQRVVQG